MSRDETDAMAEWSRTPRIPEEPDCCDISKDFMKFVFYNMFYGLILGLNGFRHTS